MDFRTYVSYRNVDNAQHVLSEQLKVALDIFVDDGLVIFIAPWAVLDIDDEADRFIKVSDSGSVDVTDFSLPEERFGSEGTRCHL